MGRSLGFYLLLMVLSFKAVHAETTASEVVPFVATGTTMGSQSRSWGRLFSGAEIPRTVAPRATPLSGETPNAKVLSGDVPKTAGSRGRPSRRRKSRRDQILFSNDGTLSSFHSYQSLNPVRSGLNLGNRVFELADRSLVNELRPEWTLRFKNQWKFHAKPVLAMTSESIKYEFPQEEKSKTLVRWDLREAFLEFLQTKDWTLRLGLLTYQWGPAELFSPSNPLFHFYRQARNYTFLEKGYVLVDAIYNFSDLSSLQILGEGISNNTPSWIFATTFSPRFLVRWSHNFENSLNYWGATVSQAERARHSLGLYGNMVPVEGMSVYLDARLSRGSLGYHPQEKTGGVVDLELRDDLQKVFGFGVVGFRYEGDYDFRFEWMRFDEGFDREEMGLALRGLSPFQPGYQKNLKRVNASGLEFLTRDYGYLSVRIPDILWKKQMSFAARWLHAMAGPSDLALLSLESPIGDAATVVLEYQQNLGAKNSEFLLTEENRLQMTLKWVYF